MAIIGQCSSCLIAQLLHRCIDFDNRKGQTIAAEMKSEPEVPITSNGSCEKSSKKMTTVSFSNVRIREYPITIGDNPSTTTGIPITIEWTHVAEIDCSIDDYESQKLEPRTMVELRLPAKLRDEMLKEQGFSVDARRNGMKAANIGRLQRRRTSETMNLAPLQEMIEKMSRATLNTTVNRRRKRKERELLSAFKK
jgi:hypothetical protein